jgi:hypothetical protein
MTVSPFVLLHEVSRLQEWGDSHFLLLREVSLLQEWDDSESPCAAASNRATVTTVCKTSQPVSVASYSQRCS